MALFERIAPKMFARKEKPLPNVIVEPDDPSEFADTSLLDSLPPPDSATAAQLAQDAMVPATAAMAPSEGAAIVPAAKGLPFIGSRTVPEQQRLISTVLGVSLATLLLLTLYFLYIGNRDEKKIDAVGNALVESQRTARAGAQAALGTKEAFPDLQQSAQGLKQSIASLNDLKDFTSTTAETEGLAKATALAARSDKLTSTIVAQRKGLVDARESLRKINLQASDLQETADALSALKLQQNAPASEISATNQLSVLTQRIGKSTNEFLTAEGVSAEATFLLGKDLSAFKEISDGLLNGSANLRLSPAKDPQTIELLNALNATFAETEKLGHGLLSNLQGLVQAREAESGLSADSGPMRLALEQVKSAYTGASLLRWVLGSLLALSALLVLLSAAALVWLQLSESRRQQALAEEQRQQAEHQEREAKRINDANQAAILRLMNELHYVAEGDLTQQATVTEDITGAIADSVNFTVDELRALVGSVQTSAARMAESTQMVEGNSQQLLDTSTRQLQAIRSTGQSVLDMASRITSVSTQAQESAAVARQSLHAADTGLQAVKNAMSSMDVLRDQIQDTSKRIKRLGESSQEIGEITELISDITEQTNVLALNAAIQAASAGDAGRGFSVVAEEVQRLAERSADATRQIAALVKTIQTDTQDAVLAMERSTHGVVQGAQLSDQAGAALTEIDKVSRQLAELIEGISTTTSKEAGSANQMAGNIEQIFNVTEQTASGTRSTAEQVRELAGVAQQLRQSVSRFKIA